MTADEYLEHWEARKVWEHNTSQHHKRRFAFIKDHLSGRRFLDCGCAFGHSTAALAAATPGQWEGVDFSEKGIAKARELFPELAFHFAPDYGALAALGRFDAVVCSEVLEHVQEDRPLVEALLGITDRLLITTPRRKINDPGHVRIYDRKEFERLFMGYRYEVFEEDPFYFVIVEHGMFEPRDDSNRTGILYSAILPHLRPGMAVLDIGCGYAARPHFQGTLLPQRLNQVIPRLLYHGIDSKPAVIAQCLAAYPWGTWTVGNAGTFVPDRHYDALFHLGFDRKDLSDAWKIHPNLLEAGKGPRVVLLEAGTRLGILSGHVESFQEVRDLYQRNGYMLQKTGEYVWSDNVTQRYRRFAVLEKAE